MSSLEDASRALTHAHTPPPLHRARKGADDRVKLAYSHVLITHTNNSNNNGRASMPNPLPSGGAGCNVDWGS